MESQPAEAEPLAPLRRRRRKLWGSQEEDIVSPFARRPRPEVRCALRKLLRSHTVQFGVETLVTPASAQPPEPLPVFRLDADEDGPFGHAHWLRSFAANAV